MDSLASLRSVAKSAALSKPQMNPRRSTLILVIRFIGLFRRYRSDAYTQPEVKVVGKDRAFSHVYSM